MHIRALESLVIPHLTEGVISPFHTVTELQHFMSSIAMKTKVQPQLTWNETMTSLSCQGKNLELDRWRKGTVQAMEDLESLLKEISGGELLNLNIPPNLSENLDKEDFGYSWVQLGPFTSPAEQALFRAIGQKFNLTSKDVNGKLVFNRPQCRSLEVKIHECQKLLLFLLKTAPAPPLRMKQYIDMRISNSQRPRNFYKDHGRNLVIIFDSKTTSQTGQDAFVCAYLPPRLARALDYFMVLVPELEYVMAAHLYPSESKDLYKEFLFVSFGKRFTADEGTQIFK